MIGDRYSLDREIGRGGMGAVHLGRDEVLGRAVAIKRVGVMPGGSTPDLERAEREARIAASLNHPHVVAVFDLVHDADQQYLVMEYVEGRTLSELVRDEGALPPERAARIIAQVADALGAAHAAGIVHRDVKPANLLVTADRTIKITDFGIARAEADASLTQTGLVTGSPAYLAPEVASGQHATPASDVWSLGASLFHALSGHPPYDVGDNVLGAMYRIVNEPPPRLESASELAPLLEATMTREVDERWSMAEVARFLRGSAPRHAARPTTSTPVAGTPVAGSVPGAGPSQGTRVLPRTTTTPPVPSSTPPPPPPPTRAPDRPEPGRRRGRLLPALVSLLVAALVVVVVLLALSDDPQDATAPGTDTTTDTASPEPTSPTSPSESPDEPAQPDADAMVGFVDGYLQTAAADPAAGYAQLSDDFQAASGGLPGYRTFWDNVTAVDVETIDADPDALTVSYTYTYTLRDGTDTTQDVTLDLVHDATDDTYLIDGEPG